MEAFQGFCLALLRAFLAGAVAQFVAQAIEVELGEQVVDSLGTHLCHKAVGVFLVGHRVVLRQTRHHVHVFVLAQGVALAKFGSIGQSGTCGINHDVALVINHRVQLLGWQPQ